MIEIKTIYEDVVLDNVNSAENGELNFLKFNRLSRRAELRMLDFLSGDINNAEAPLPYLSQKNKDWLSLYIKKYPQQVKDGKIIKPDDYYGYENMYKLGSYISQADCEEEVANDKNCNTPIKLLEGSKFNKRCQTKIEGKQPSIAKPIAKEVGSTFEFNPSDLGSIELEYIAYPVFGKVVITKDTVFNQEVVDEARSTNYQYSEWARELLVYFISQMFNIGTRENALNEQLRMSGKLVRDSK